MSRNKKSNKFVSTSKLTNLDVKNVLTLFIEPIKCRSTHGNANSKVWDHFGWLKSRPDHQDGEVGEANEGGTPRIVLLDEDKYYCNLCLLREQEQYRKSYNANGIPSRASPATSGHISRVAKYGLRTSSTNFADHLRFAHDLDVAMPDAKQRKLDSCLVAKTTPATSPHEFNRDLALWFARDIMAFSRVANEGFKAFFSKNLPNMTLPSPATLSIGALGDLYFTMRQKLKENVADVPSVCVMFDGWTDLHRAIPYLGFKISYIDKAWDLQIMTVSVKSLHSHTGKSLATV